MQASLRLAGNPGRSALPLRSMMPTPESEAPSTRTPLLTPVSCTLTHVPFASRNVSPPSGGAAKQAASSEPSGVVALVPSPARTRGTTRSEGAVDENVEAAKGARSQRS